MAWNPGIIAQYEERTAKLKADVPTLEGIMSKKWGKEDEFKQLKSDLAALDRKIQAEIALNMRKPTASKTSRINLILLILLKAIVKRHW